jgi:uncharacterized membrane protein YphA (DoxX/SURF4 family)
MVPLGIRIYGLGAVALGLVGLVWGDFALQWRPVAAGFPGRTALAYLFSAALVIAGVCVNGLNPQRAVGAAALTGLYAVVVLFMHGPQIFQHPGAFAAWDGAAEQLALFAGGLATYARLSGANGRPGSNDVTGGTDRPRSTGRLGDYNRLGGQNWLGRAAVIIMGACLLMFGLAHFLYLDFTASMVPAWLPGGQKFWAAATGAGHLAAGIALLSGIKARLAAILLTVMFGSFSVLVHLPLLLADPHNHLGWVMNAINLALTGAAWSIATLLTGHVSITRGRVLDA